MDRGDPDENGQFAPNGESSKSGGDRSKTHQAQAIGITANLEPWSRLEMFLHKLNAGRAALLQLEAKSQELQSC
jgi:hypothetical protein